jgi:transposase
MAEIEKKTKRYPTDLTDEEWARIEPFLPGAAKSGRPARTDLREVLNAIRYLARSGGGWRMLPKDFPPWPTVYWWFRRFVRRFLFQTIHDVALMPTSPSEVSSSDASLTNRRSQTDSKGPILLTGRTFAPTTMTSIPTVPRSPLRVTSSVDQQPGPTLHPLSTVVSCIVLLSGGC